jgi:hypothetical protein
MKITVLLPKLTLNLGVRYMNNGVLVPTEHNYSYSYFDFSTGTRAGRHKET